VARPGPLAGRPAGVEAAAFRLGPWAVAVWVTVYATRAGHARGIRPERLATTQCPARMSRLTPRAGVWYLP